MKGVRLELVGVWRLNVLPLVLSLLLLNLASLLLTILETVLVTGDSKAY